MFGSRECLAVEAAGAEMRGVVVQRARNRTEIRDFVALPRPEPHDDLPDIETLREFKERLGYRDRGEAVFITAMARAVVIPMNRTKVAAMRRQQLAEAVKWEVEPFTGISGRLALTGMFVEELKSKPGQVVEESEEVMVNISVLEKNVYRAIKERFKLANLKLMRIYPPEVCFYVPLLDVHEESDRGVLEVGQGYSSFALLRGGEPKVISTLSVTTEVFQEHLEGRTVPDLEESVKFFLRQAPPPHSLAITGTGAMDGRIVDFINELSPTGAEPVTLRRTSGLTAAGEEESPAFASAAGAAMREVGGGGLAEIGISDAVPYSLKLKQNAYLMPLITTVVFIAVLLGHHQFMSYRERGHKQRIEILKAEVQEKKRQNAQALDLQKQLDQVTKKIEETARRKQFASSEGDQTLGMLAGVFRQVAAHIPATMALNAILQDPGNPRCFVLTGSCPRAADVGHFAVLLNRGSMNLKVVVEQFGEERGDKPYAAKDAGEKKGKGKGKGKGKETGLEGANLKLKKSIAKRPRRGPTSKGSAGLGGAEKGGEFIMTLEVDPKHA